MLAEAGIIDPKSDLRAYCLTPTPKVAEFHWKTRPDNFGTGGRIKLESVAEFVGMRNQIQKQAVSPLETH